jgi:hypothetical protein
MWPRMRRNVSSTGVEGAVHHVSVEGESGWEVRIAWRARLEAASRQVTRAQTGPGGCELWQDGHEDGAKLPEGASGRGAW